MIIGISGKINSGKDTVAAIIQYLIWKNKVEKGEKTNLHYTFKDFTNSKFGGNTLSNWEIKKFADKLKDMISILLGCTREQLEDRVFKETPLGEEWWYYKFKFYNGKNPDGSIKLFPYLSYDGDVGNKELVCLTPRKLLQLLGTECGRQIIHPNIWVNATMADYDRKLNSEEEIRLLNIWKNINTRCTNPNYEKYNLYGGKGIINEFLSFEIFKNWSKLNGYTNELTIDRIDSNSNYNHNNCRWVTPALQAFNQGVYKNSKSELRGVSIKTERVGKFSDTWVAQIQCNGKKEHLGYFTTSKEAQIIYNKRYKELELELLKDSISKQYKYPNVIITDVRFKNEADAIKQRGGIIIRVNRPCKECGVLEGHKMIPHKNKPSEHESETALDDYEFNYIVDNSGTIEELIVKIKDILIERGVL